MLFQAYKDGSHQALVLVVILQYTYFHLLQFKFSTEH